MRYLLFLLISITWIACGGSSDTLDYETKVKIDSLTAKGYASVDSMIKTSCADTSLENLQPMIDSLILIREAEIEQIVGWPKADDYYYEEDTIEE